MKILKEEKLNEYVCPKCGSGLDYGGQERYENAKWWSSNFYTGNNWYECIKCNKRYLVKNDAEEVIPE